MLSVIVVTNRVGGLDALFAGLREQSFRDFRVWVVDELVERQRFAWPSQEPVFVRCRPGLPRWGRYMASLNAALYEERRLGTPADRFVFWSDYTCPHPETLATHARFHEEHPDDIMLGGIEYCELPKLHPDFPLKYGWLAMGHDVSNHKTETYAPWLNDQRRHELYEEWRQNYEADLDAGKLDQFMWSTFETPIKSFADVENLRVFNHDRRDTSPFLNLKNDSIPRHWLDKIGGFDERADGSHGHQDSITWRQLAKVGAKLQVRAENPVKLCDPHGIAVIRSFRDGKDDTSNVRLAAEAQ